MKFEDKSIIIDKFIELAKKSKLNSEQKKRIVQLIENLNETTETQKERFILYYGLNEYGPDAKNLNKIAKIYGCTASAVRGSVISVKNKLSKLNEEFKVIEQVVTECENN